MKDKFAADAVAAIQGKPESLLPQDVEFVAECEETGERVAFTMADLYGWDDETVYLDTSIYGKRLKNVNWAIIYRDDFARRLNPNYRIHFRTEQEGDLIEPLKLLSIKQYPQYRFRAEFNNHIIRTGSLCNGLYRDGEEREGLPFGEDEFELAEMTPRGLKVRNDILVSAKYLWRMSEVYVHYGCSAKDFHPDKFKRIKNIPFSAKPAGGFWASPAGGRGSHPFGWEDFCRRDGYRPRAGLDHKFFFCLDAGAWIFRIEGRKDFDLLPKIRDGNGAFTREAEFVDFGECFRRGVDAIIYSYSALHSWGKDMEDEMDRNMLGWDCDSILILNPDIILRDSFMEADV